MRAIAGKKLFLLVFLVMTGCASIVYTVIDFDRLYGPSAPKQRVLTPEGLLLSEQQHKVSYYKEVKPILDSRCVTCHGCYDAPCQLKLGSIEGVDRGASKEIVYDSSRLKAADPSRLFVDASMTEDWRKKGFYPILNERIDTNVANLDNSIVAKLLSLKHLNPQPTSGKLGEEYALDINRTLQCPTLQEVPAYQHDHPQWGMPYAMPGLSQQEEHTLTQWLQEGSKVEPLPPLSLESVKAVGQWENYFNGSSLKQKLVFRYIYEHLFIGHIHFKGHPENEFFQWVRSKTGPGQPIKEINTVRPYDDPGIGRFYYRLRAITETIVDKTHFVYELSDERKQRYDELFFEPDYQVTVLPSYSPEVAANPFKAFFELPPASKYKFMLDEAEYFVSGFIKGPVCRGEVATESIRDQFWVVFMKPRHFYPKKAVQFLADNYQLLGLPGEEGDQIGLFGWSNYDDFGRQYLKHKDNFINSVLSNGQGLDLNTIWDGEGSNHNAALTIFRHFDSATVLKGFIGGTPLTGWVIDYPIFERLHYLLVAGFNVYGSAGHQLASRTYMDILRQDAEDNFLRFMPAMERLSIYNTWYAGIKGVNGLRNAEPLFSIGHETQVKYQTSNYKKEFFDQIRQRLGSAAGVVDTINGCEQVDCSRDNITPIQQQVDSDMRKLAKFKGLQLSALPELSLVRVIMGAAEEDRVYSLITDKAYSNISKLLEGSNRLPEQDSVTIVPGFIGSYPNFFFTVEKAHLMEFINTLGAARTEIEKDTLYSQFGLRRTHPKLWQHVDWFNQQYKEEKGLSAGLLDMSRYENL